MAKHSRSKKARKNRRWFNNVGDGAKLSREGQNPNDKPREK